MGFNHQTIKLIQGGMGVYVSNWRLARTVAAQRPGVTAGTVSGTALDIVHARLLQLGDPGGHIRQALLTFDRQFDVEVGHKIIERYYLPGGKKPGERFKNTPMHHLRPLDTSVQGLSRNLTLDADTIEMMVATAFAEVWLARQGHNGAILINFLNKIELPLLYAMYGAMLAGVDGIVVGAGNPDGLPAVCDQLARHQPVSQHLSMLYREAGEDFELVFDPRLIASGKLAQQALNRPQFLAIVSLENLVLALAQSPSTPPDGFIIEHHTAGGHNAGPQGPLNRDSRGQPIYSALDEPKLDVIRSAGKPFWLAGGYGSHERYLQALQWGAQGIQVGSLFAMSQESGMLDSHRRAILDALKQGRDEKDLVLTTLFSPTGYPFKVAQVSGTLSDDAVYLARRRVCDIGLLQQRGLTQADADGSRKIFQRCMAAPIEDFTSKRGLPRNAEEKRCLCNGLLAAVGLGQNLNNPAMPEEPAIVTLGDHLDGVRRLSRSGQTVFWASDVINDILDEN